MVPVTRNNLQVPCWLLGCFAILTVYTEAALYTNGTGAVPVANSLVFRRDDGLKSRERVTILLVV